MNRKIAIALVVGFIFSIATAFITSETRYYYLGNDAKREITKIKYIDTREYFSAKEKNYNSIFIIVGFIGGFGVGYLVVDYGVKNIFEKSKLLIKRKK